MAHYYINKNPQSVPESGEHEVHKDSNCSKAPFPENRISLGDFSDCKDALTEARKRFPDWKIDGCEECNNECHKI
jgi:hypothetical protein